MNRYKKANEGIHAPEEVKEKAARPSQKRPYSRWIGAVAAVLVLALIGGAALWPGQGGEPMLLSDGPGVPAGDPSQGGGNGQARTVPEEGANGGSDGAPLSYQPYALVLAAYPETAPYPKDDQFLGDEGQFDYDAWNSAYDAWQNSRAGLRSERGRYGEGFMDRFWAQSAAEFLSGAGEDNLVYSPLNIYMALSMLAETTGENSRAQLLDLLGADSIETVRAQAAALWRDHYRDDGTISSILANSLWLRDDMTYSRETLDTLAREYYASSFSGKMGSEAYDQALRDWINGQTGGLLAEQASGLEMSPATVLALASTIYFKAAWQDEFNQALTRTDTFHTPSGDEDADFMHLSMWNTFYWGDSFTAISLSFQNGGNMWLILPAEGCSVDELLASGEALDFLLADKRDTYGDNGEVVKEGWTGQKGLTVNLTMPKFDVSSDLDLIGGLKNLGVTDIFGPGANFDPLGASTDVPLYVSKAQHAARVKVDEEGCEAAAYTVIMVDAGCALMPLEDEVDFVLDRPFLFAVNAEWTGFPLFMGVVNQPS